MNTRVTGLFILFCFGTACAAVTATRAGEKVSRVHALVEPTGDRAADLRLLVQKRGLSDKLARLTALFPSSNTGKAMATAAALCPMGLRADNQADSTLLAAQLGILVQNPSRTLSELSQALPKLGATYAEGRQFLVQFAARLPLPKAQVLAFLSAEMQRPVAAPPAEGPSDISFFNPAVALDSLMEVTQDTSVIEGYLAPVLKSTTAPMQEKRLLLSRYFAAYPANARKLGDQYGIPK